VIDRIAPTLRPLDERPVMRQLWRDLLFLHWPIAPAEIQSRLPPGLTVDTFDGIAYIGLVPFSMLGVRPVWSPPVPGLSAFHEVNVRTYAHRNGRDPGVWFFSLDAANPIAVAIARLRWQLPYFNAEIQLQRTGTQIEYTAQRRPGWGGTPAAHTAVIYNPEGTPSASSPGTLEHFLAERYLLYTANPNGRLGIGQVHHTPYPLQPASVIRLEDTLVAAAGFTVPDITPIAHYASGVDVDIYRLRPVTTD